jgi:transcriptional regulator with XRE-family HTH domain
MADRTKNLVLLELRKSEGLRQRDLAEQAGVCSTYICQLETGQSRIGADVARRIRDAYRREMNNLGFTLEHLIDGTHTANPLKLQNSSVGQTPDPEPAA